MVKYKIIIKVCDAENVRGMIAGVITPSSLSLMQRYYCVQAKTNMCGINFHIKMKKHGLQGVQRANRRYRKGMMSE